MGYRMSAEEKRAQEVWQAQWDEYWLESERWSAMDYYLSKENDEEWIKARWDEIRAQGSDYHVYCYDHWPKERFTYLAALEQETFNLYEKRKPVDAETAKMRKRGWCHKADDNQKIADQMIEKERGAEDAIKVICGQMERPVKPLNPSEKKKINDDLEAKAGYMGCLTMILFWGAVLGLLFYFF